jgi:hypothetical protein
MDKDTDEIANLCRPPEFPKYDPRWTSEERAQELLASISGGHIRLSNFDGTSYRTAKLTGRNGIEVSCDIDGPTSDPDVFLAAQCTLLNKFFETTERWTANECRHLAEVEALKDQKRRANRWADWFWWLK